MANQPNPENPGGMSDVQIEEMKARRDFGEPFFARTFVQHGILIAAYLLLPLPFLTS